jgi:hypothetical protein
MPRDRDKAAPSLEPPSLFRRKKRSRPEPAEPTPPPRPAVEAEPATPIAPPDPPLGQDSPLVDDSTVPMAAEVPKPAVATQPEPLPEPPPGPSTPREPWLHGLPAAVLTGLFVGALIVAATAGSLRLCSAVKGTSSCGGSGFLLLVAILVVAVIVGAAMLRGAQVPEPASTSFLAVGLLSVVTLLFLVGSIFEWWMIIVIPLCSVATFLLSYWVTTSYIRPGES